MSMLLMVKAMQCRIGNPARKLVLLKLADNANDNGVCFPSYQHIADQCEITRRSAISHIDALIEMGFVEKKERKTPNGNTSNIYFLNLNGGENITLPSENISPPSENISPTPSENISPPSENISPTPSENISPRTSHSINQSINHTNLSVSNALSHEKSKSEVNILADFGITDQLAKDFIKLRKAKKAPITQTAMELLQKQADLAKTPLLEVVEVIIERGWTGFNANWDWRGDNRSAVKNSRVTKSFADDGSWAIGRKLDIDPDLIPEELR